MVPAPAPEEEGRASRLSLIDTLPPEVRQRARTAPFPRWFEPMKATLVDEPFSRSGWLFEPKLDGVRCLVFRHGGRLELWSRNHLPLNSQYPELSQAFQEEPAPVFIVDGEIAALENGVSSFSRLQQRMQVRDPSPDLRRRVPVRFYAFDLLYLDDSDLRTVPLRHRKQLLKRALAFDGRLTYTAHRATDGKGYFAEACRRHWEGIIAKDGDSCYVSRRSRDWQKFKCIHEQEFVVIGYTDPKGQRAGFGALLVGYYDHGALAYAGKVGTGFDTATLGRMSRQLASLQTGSAPWPAPRGVHWVKPKLVAQLAFTEWTSDGKLRHPRFVGLRNDKDPREVVREG